MRFENSTPILVQINNTELIAKPLIFPFQTQYGVDADAVAKDVEALKLEETITQTPAAATELPPVLKRFFDVFFLYNKFLVLEMRPWCERELQQLVAPVSELLKLGG